MNNICKELLSPFVIGNTVFKNRIVAATSEPHYLNGPESYPNDAVLLHYRNKAKGAAIVNVTGLGEMGDTRKYPPFLPMSQFPDYNVFDVRNANMFIRLTDVIHYYQSQACAVLEFFYEERSFDCMGEKYCVPKKENIEDYTVEELENIKKYLVMQAKACEKVGFDMISIHCAYGRTLEAKIVSGAFNHRTDEYGGSPEKRMRLMKETCEEIRRACPNMLIHMLISGHEDGQGGNTLEETIAMLKTVEGLVDIVEVRGSNADLSHPTGFDEETPSIREAAIIKQNVKTAVQCVGGFFKPETCEAAIASGMVDFVGMARAWICNPDYGELLYEGKLDEIVPCIRCNKCHTFRMTPPWKSACSVNPMLNLEKYQDELPFKNYEKKKIAVIGGGPAGMKAAAAAADRGHEVTIFEAKDRLGGQLIHSDLMSFKWPLRDFKNYLIRQVEKRVNIQVRLNESVSPESIRKMGFDVVFAATGSVPVVPPIDGIRENAVSAAELWNSGYQPGRKIGIIGGGEIGIETAMYLAENGHEVTVLEMKNQLAADANPIHYKANLDLAWAASSAEGITNARVTKVSPGRVEYTDIASGESHTLEVDSVIYAAGMKADRKGALAYKDSAPGFAVIGDPANPVNNLIYALQSAIAAANRF